jgi:hypothetical protein
VNNDDVKLIVATGDIENHVTIDTAFQDNLLSYFPGHSVVPWFVAIGNHNVEDATDMEFVSEVLGPRLTTQLPGMSNFQEGPYDDTYAWTGRYTTYSFDYRNAHFVVLNQYLGSRADASRHPLACPWPDLVDWLSDDLAANTQPITFLFGHEPAFVYESGNNHCGDSLDDGACPGNRAPEPDRWKAYRPARDAFWQLLRDYEVVAHFDGHIHEGSARAVRGIEDFDMASCIDSDWNCYCNVERDVPLVADGAELIPDDGVVEFNSGLTASAGPVNVIRVACDTVTFTVYTRGSGTSLSLVKSFDYTVAPQCSLDPDCVTPPPCRTAQGATCDDGTCIYAAAAKGTPCSDNDACTSPDECDDQASCVPGGWVCECHDASECTTPAECHTASGATCVGGACTYPDLSDGVACSVDDDPCTADTCQAGVCAHVVSEGLACEDGDSCTESDSCSASGACLPGASVCACRDATDCTDPPTCRAAAGAACVGNACQYPAVADGTVCAADSNPCTADHCESGSCVHPLQSGLACDDGDPCTLSDVCAADGSCTPGDRSCACDDTCPTDCVDQDGDGHYDAECGGDDCDDANANAYRCGAAEVIRGGGCSCATGAARSFGMLAAALAIGVWVSERRRRRYGRRRCNTG